MPILSERRQEAPLPGDDPTIIESKTPLARTLFDEFNEVAETKPDPRNFIEDPENTIGVYDLDKIVDALGLDPAQFFEGGHLLTRALGGLAAIYNLSPQSKGLSDRLSVYEHETKTALGLSAVAAATTMGFSYLAGASGGGSASEELEDGI
ncbi:MAG: hypothetical protein RLN62_05235 [Rickettsiales bacterium]